MSYNIFDELWKIFGLLIGIIIFIRILYIFIYPIFFYSSARISNSDENNNIEIISNVLYINDTKKIPIVNVTYCDNDEKISNIPIATIV